MRIAQRQTAIDNYYGNVVKNVAPTQNSRVMAVVQIGKDYSLCELIELVNAADPKHPMDRSSMSRTVNNLRAAGRLVACDVDRPCKKTGVVITPSKLPAKQGDLFK